MKQLGKKFFETYGLIILMFIFWGVVFWQIPLVQDSWAGQIYNSQSDIFTWMKNASQLYFTTNGRIISFIVVGFFERNEMLLDVANAVFMTLLVWLMSKTIRNEASYKMSVLIWGLLLLASVRIRTEVYFYATMIYVLPVLFFILFILYVQMYKNISGISEKTKFVILCIIGIINSGWIEHSSFAFVFILGIYWLVDLIKNRKINIKFTVFELLNGITFIIMMFSPGLRLQRQISSEGSLWNTIVTNMGYTVQAIIYDHKMLFLILIIASMIVVYQKVEKKSILFGLYQFIMALYALVLGVNLVFDFLGGQLPEILVINANVWYPYSMLWSILGIILILLLFIPLLFTGCKKELIFAYWVGMFSLAPTIITPNFAHRICFFAYVIIVFITAGVIADIDLKQKRERNIVICLIVAILFVQIDRYAILLANINKIQEKREYLIELVKEEQLLGIWDYDKTLILPRFSEDQLYAAASPQPFNDLIHYQVFLSFYELNPETLVLFSNDRNELRVSEESEGIVLEIIPENPGTEYQYMYYMMSGDEIMWCSESTDDKMVRVEIPKVSGNYRFVCDMISESGNITSVFSVKMYTVK